MHDASLEMISAHAKEGCRLREEFFRDAAPKLQKTARIMAQCLDSGGKLLLCGNGGSAADAQHVAAEFVGRFLKDRPALPAIALNCNTSSLTAIGNDMGYDTTFSRQVEAFGKEGDVLLAYSTSGKSPNVLAALQAAWQKGLVTVGFTGQGGGQCTAFCDILLDVPSTRTPLIQEIHIAASHVICLLAEYYLYENTDALASDDEK
ncbi:MAG: D-sedoheptulose 7-phosphate isomerase [Desulfovibrio sp.]|nr:D-sedoheptulose 7-phosphate isomerase [Desulfovibrio sp.]